MNKNIKSLKNKKKISRLKIIDVLYFLKETWRKSHSTREGGNRSHHPFKSHLYHSKVSHIFFKSS